MLAWNGIEILMVPQGFWNSKNITNAFSAEKEKILPSKYEEVYLKEYADSQEHLEKEQRNNLAELFEKYKGLLKGKVGNYTGEPVKLKLKKGAESFRNKASIWHPKSHQTNYER